MQSLSAFFDEMLGDIDPNCSSTRRTYPFGVRVGCVKMCAPRHERFDLIRDLGFQDIDLVFSGKSFNKDVLTFAFPERHMSVHEQQAFMHAMLLNENIDIVKQVDMITSSPLIIGNFQRDAIRILTWQDDELHNGTVGK